MISRGKGCRGRKLNKLANIRRLERVRSWRGAAETAVEVWRDFVHRRQPNLHAVANAVSAPLDSSTVRLASPKKKT